MLPILGLQQEVRVLLVGTLTMWLVGWEKVLAAKGIIENALYSHTKLNDICAVTTILRYARLALIVNM